MAFTTFIPCAALQPFVRQLAIQEAEEQQTYKVLPGTGLVIGFQYSGSLGRVEGDETMPLSTAGITGLHDSYNIFTNTPRIGTVLVFFKETGAAAFFKQPLHELFRQSVSLDNFMLHSALLIVEEQLCEAKSAAARIKIVETFLLGRLHEAIPDQLVLAALSLIHKNGGNIRIQQLAQQLHTSQSPLEKRFRKAVGASPKKFASIVRIKHAIKQFSKQSSLTALGYDAGFYDQAHFIKEFKTFTGETPEAYFNRGIEML